MRQRTQSKSFNLPALLGWLVFVAILFVCDQWTKYWIQNRMIVGDSERITSFFNLVVAYNSGAAFSFLADAGGWQKYLFCFLALAISCAICLYISWHSSKKLMCFGLSLVMAGALANAWDRFSIGAVVDFLDFHVAGYHWPAFNVADICICCGAFIVVLTEFLAPRH